MTKGGKSCSARSGRIRNIHENLGDGSGKIPGIQGDPRDQDRDRLRPLVINVAVVSLLESSYSNGTLHVNFYTAQLEPNLVSLINRNQLCLTLKAVIKEC
jgi:hypothetical protein